MVGTQVTAPSFREFESSSELASRIKSRNRATDTTHELLLRQMLWRDGLRYRKNVPALAGKPDIVFSRQRVVIFCDGDFWHGRNWERLKAKLADGHNAPYWLQKICANRERDLQHNEVLKKAGWRVLRFWETDIKRSPELVLLQIKLTLSEQEPIHRARR